MAKNELMVVENFALAINGEIADIMAEELDGLGESPFDVQPDKIGNIPVLSTYLGGRKVYAAE